MIDNPEKTVRLLAALKQAVPFKVELVPSLVKFLRAQHVAIAERRHGRTFVDRSKAQARTSGRTYLQVPGSTFFDANWVGELMTRHSGRIRAEFNQIGEKS